MNPLQHVQALHAARQPILGGFGGRLIGGPDVRLSFDATEGTLSASVSVRCTPEQLAALLRGEL